MNEYEKFLHNLLADKETCQILDKMWNTYIKLAKKRDKVTKRLIAKFWKH